jgi:hypothetical protein
VNDVIGIARPGCAKHGGAFRSQDGKISDWKNSFGGGVVRKRDFDKGRQHRDRVHAALTESDR